MVLQFVLLAIILVAAVSLALQGLHPPLLHLLGVALVVAGLVLAGWAAASLGRALVPWPRPVGHHIIDTGPFGWVRHPIYTGGLLCCLGLALAVSWWLLVPTAALAVTWALKCRVEERMLLERFADYDAYCQRVRWRLCPGLY